MKMFKFFGMTLFLLGLGLTAQGADSTYYTKKKSAATATPTPTPMPTPPAPVAAQKPRRFFVSALYSSADQIDYKGNVPVQGVSTPYTATQPTGSALGVSGGYFYYNPGALLGFSGDLTYELPRTSPSISGTAGNYLIGGTYTTAPSTPLLTAAANLDLWVAKSFYLLAGLNFPFVFTSGSESLTGQPGFQLGGGALIGERFSVELQYRELFMKGSINAPGLTLDINQATFSGLILSLHYRF